MSNKTQNEIVYQEPIKSASVVIPCRNEEETVGPAVRDIAAALDTAKIDYEIIVVDDASTDRSRERALEAGARVLVHNINMGYGNSIMDGMKISMYPVIAIMDADGTYPASKLPAMLEEASRYDMVIGARIWSNWNTSLLGRLMRRVLYCTILYFSNVRARDFNSGFRVFHKQNILDYRQILCPTFSFTTSLTLLHLLTCKSVFFVEIEYSKRVGSSKVLYIRDAIRTFSYVFLLISLFQPYRLSIIIIILSVLLNAAIIVFSSVFSLSQSTQIGLHISISVVLLLAAIAVNINPTAKKYLDQLHVKYNNES